MAITKIVTPELFDFSSLNTALQLPTGTTAERPGTLAGTLAPVAGEWRYNTTLSYVEYYDGTSPYDAAKWFQIDDEAIPSGIPVGNEHFNVNTYFGNGATQAIDAKFNEAAAFSGVLNGSFINLGNNAIFSPATQGALTFSCWIKTSSGNAGYIASKVNDSSSPSPTYEWAIEHLSNGTLTLIAYNAQASVVASSINNTATIDDGNWHNVVAVIVNNTASINGSTTLYIDGVSATSTSWTGTAAESSVAVVFLGAVGKSDATPPVQSGAAQHYGGLMDQVRFYNSALDQADVTALQLETTTTASSLSFPSGETAIATYQLDGNGDDISTNYNGTTTDIGYTGLKFQPDFTWIKAREASSSHVLFDSVRGVSNVISTESTSDQSSLAPNGLTAFNNDGFTVKDIASGGNGVNGSAGGTYSGTNASYVAWNWYAPTAETNNAGANGADIASTIKKNVDAGFSIVKYEANGSTTAANSLVQSGLSQEVEMFIHKNIDASGTWFVYHKDTGEDNIMRLTDAAKQAFADFYAVDTNGNFGIRQSSAGTNGQDCIAYCFHSVAGYSKVDSYQGGQTLNTANQVDFGFAPAFVLIKNTTDSGSQWMIFDDKRTNGYALFPNRNVFEEDYSSALLLSSQGLEFKSVNINVNRSGSTYIYLAIAS